MKILLHTCCGPCTIYPLKELRGAGHEVMGYYHRRNIHPYTECMRREETLLAFAEAQGLRVVTEKGYAMEEWLRSMVYREAVRCPQCYHDRLTAAAHMARRGKFDAYTTTLLYSRFQKHEVIAEIGESVGKSLGVPFHYQDFRTGWREGIEESRRLGMYRQPYCGCIYSEKDRYCPKNF